MSAIDGLTVCVTSYRRAAHLDRALESVRRAGIRRVTICASDPDTGTLQVIQRHAHGQFSQGWLSFDVGYTKFDVGCNSTWLHAVYLAKTNRVLVLHDDDCLAPDFASTYESLIAPELDRSPTTFASWRASLLFEDGSEKFTEYFQGPTRVLPSAEIAKVVNGKGRLSLSPVVSILDRRTIIDACKESEQTLTHNDCLYRPGMLLGTEIISYLRMVRNFPRWLYVDQILSRYGSHDGSGTVYAEKGGGTSYLARGYDIARMQCRNPPPRMQPKIIFVHCPNPNADADERARNAIARESWDFHFGQGDMIELEVDVASLKRTGTDIGDARAVPYIKDLFDAGCAMATQDDVVVYCNQDIVLSTGAVERIVSGVIRGKGATCCQRRRLNPQSGRFYKNFANCKTDGGFDVMAVTPGWWKANRDKMPDLLVGKEAVDTCFRVLAEESADGRNRNNTITSTSDQWSKSNAYTDHVAGHKAHESNWIVERHTSLGNLHNRALAREFFRVRGNLALVAELK